MLYRSHLSRSNEIVVMLIDELENHNVSHNGNRRFIAGIIT